MKILELLRRSNKDLIVSFYLDNTIGVFRSNGVLDNSPMNRPMGICLLRDSQNLAISFAQGIAGFIQVRFEDKFYYRQSNIKYNGFVNGHELVSVHNHPVLVNTLFNCLSTFGLESKDFKAIWMPPGIKKIVPEDKIHLNGVALAETGEIAFASAFSSLPGEKGHWKGKENLGCVWDVQTNSLVLEKLSLPHSPRVIKDNLVVCNSGKGEIIFKDLTTGDRSKISIDAFVRGLVVIDNFLIVGVSKIRKNNPVVKLKNNFCGLYLIDLSLKKVCDRIEFKDKKDIFDLQLIPCDIQVLTADSQTFSRCHLI